METTELAHLACKNAAITGRLHQAIGIKIINSLKLSPHADGPAHRADIQRQHISDLVQQSEGIAAFPVDLVDEGDEDRKSTRLNSITNAHLVCRLLLEKQTTNTQAHKRY